MLVARTMTQKSKGKTKSFKIPTVNRYPRNGWKGDPEISTEYYYYYCYCC